VSDLETEVSEHRIVFDNEHTQGRDELGWIGGGDLRKGRTDGYGGAALQGGRHPYCSDSQTKRVSGLTLTITQVLTLNNPQIGITST
jgi:hypothetical protein